MARTVRVGEFQNMQRAGSTGPSHQAMGEMEALGDAEQNGQDRASMDPLTGQVVDAEASPTPSVAELLKALGVELLATADMPLGQIVGMVREKTYRLAYEQKILVEESDIRTEAERIWTSFGDARTPVVSRIDGGDVEDDLRHGDSDDDYPTESDAPCDRCGGVVMLNSAEEDQRLAHLVAAGRLDEILCDACAAADPIEPKAEDRAAPVEYDVGPDGIVEGVRPAEMTPDRGPDVGTTHHTVTDEEPRFSGAGATMTDGPTSDLIPRDIDFQKRQYRAAPELANLAEALMERHGFFEELLDCKLDFKWQRIGTNSQGKRSIGTLKRVSGPFVDYCEAQFIVCLSADTARMAGFTDRQVEAALFHQLLHIGKDKKGNWIRVGHDFEGFGTEVRHYGPWTEDLKIGSQAFSVATQLGLDLDGAEDEDDEPAVAGTPDDVYGGYEDRPADPDRPYDDEAEGQHEGDHEASMYDQGELADLPTDEEIDASRTGSQP